ncbi:MAG: hydroxyacid dehydrogenase [Verrucomicrobiota bacterium JB024]|nr:hydroxyacid dehydrogenase [Verrucomicrobiota bacterium JB024]
MNRPLSQNLPEAPPRPKVHRLACAILERDRRRFFPDGLRVDGCEIAEMSMRPDSWLEELETFNPDILLSGWATPVLPASWFESGRSRLAYICNITGSVRKFLPRCFLESGGLVSNWGALCAPQVAEHALLLALSALRKQSVWREFMMTPLRDRDWRNLETQTLHGRRVGIHGFGHVARALVLLLQPFGVTVEAYSEGVPASLMRKMDVQPVASLSELFHRSEVLFECEALTIRSEDSVDAELLAQLPDGAVFVNVGRGKVVVEPALIAEAASGRIHVALDVCVSDPVQPGAVLLDVPQIILSPHIAGPTIDQFPALGRQALVNLQRFVRGEPLENLLTLEIYDRST